MVAACSVISPSPVWARTPMPASKTRMVLTSRRCGTLASASGSSVSRLAHMMGSAAFLAPEMRTSPRNGPLPRILSLSMARAFHGGPGIGCQRLHGERVDFFAHAIAQRRVHQLVLLHFGQARKTLADDDRFEVMAVAAHF